MKLLCDHVPNVGILNRCNTFSMESQLQRKRLKWPDLVFGMPDDRLLKSLFGEVNGLRPSGRRRSSFNDAALCDGHNCRINRP